MKSEIRINRNTGVNAKRIRMKRRLQLRDSLNEYGEKANNFWLLRSRHMNNISTK